MTDDKPELAAISESERDAVLKKFYSIRPFLEDGIALPALSKQTNVPLRTLRRWVKQYRGHGLTGLIRKERRISHSESEIILNELIEGLLLETPKKSIASIKRALDEVAKKQGWECRSYSSIYRIAASVDKRLIILAQKGSKAYSDKFDLVYRRESIAPNQIWQADHCLLDCWLANNQDRTERPWLTAILDDYSRVVCGYLLSFDAPCSMNTAITLHQAIWRKNDLRWHVQGIPSCFYTDNGSDFTSNHMEYVAAEMKMQLIFSIPGKPRGRGKMERFFRTVNDTFLSGVAGFKNSSPTGALTLPQFTALFHTWMLEKYMAAEHSELGCAPQQKWEQGGFLPRQADSLEQLDLLLFTVPTSRKVHQDGIHYQSLRYIDPTLAAYVGESVTIRYDPRDLAEIRVFHNDKFLCRAVCTQLESTAVSLKEIVRARNQRRRELRSTITKRSQLISDYIATHVVSPAEIGRALVEEPGTKARLRRYHNED